MAIFRYDGKQVVITGAIGEGHAPSTFTIAVDDPALFAALALKDALVRRGVRVDGDAVARHRDVTESFAASTADPLASRTSPSLIELLRVTDKVSQNLHAELMLRFASPDGTREAGLESMRDFLKSLGAGQDDYRIDDGSGLSRNDLVTPSLVARLLTHMYGSEHREQWISLLPVGGEDGTLSNRLCCTSDGTRVHAKTGTLARSVALSGYADSRSHGMLAFSILVNDFSAPSATVRQWVDKMALALTE